MQCFLNTILHLGLEFNVLAVGYLESKMLTFFVLLILIFQKLHSSRSEKKIFENIFINIDDWPSLSSNSKSYLVPSPRYVVLRGRRV